MSEDTELDEYLIAIREQVCTHCNDRPPGGPPCAPLGKRCGIEANLARLVDAVHAIHSPVIDPYITEFHDEVCTHCLYRPTNQCPCPLDHLLLLAVQAIEDVDQQRAAALPSGPTEL
ncbi:MAG TPA: hypothetical protein VGH32_07620 [Pirellulales bacterium]